MTMIHTLMVLAAAAAADPRGEVLEFSATWCGPCQRMSPIVSRLEREGLPIHKIDVDEQRDLARRYNVTSIPSFILVIDGQEVNRIVGSTSEAEIRRMIARIPQPQPEPEPQPQPQPEPPDTIPLDDLTEPAREARGQVPRQQTEPALVQSEPEPETGGRGGFFDFLSRDSRAEEPAVVRGVEDEIPSSQPGGVANDPLVGSTRIRVTINDRVNLGSGTIIGSQPGVTLVLTCGHIFRGLNNSSKVEVDVFEGASFQTVVGTVRKFDIESDVGLITIPLDHTVPTVAVCPPSNLPARGDRVACIGCSGGEDPTREQLEVTEINKYQGPDNIECTGIPVQGRSGGGLFNTDGELIGVCVAADPEGHRGLYAHVTTIHDLLDECDLTWLYQPVPPEQAPAEEILAGNAAVPPTTTEPVAVSPSPSAAQGLLEQAGITNIPAGDAEVVVIIRPKNQPQAPSRVVIINQASPKFFAYLNGELDTPATAQTTERIVPTTQTVPAPPQLPEWYESRRISPDAADTPATTTANKESLQPTALSRPSGPQRYIRSAATR